jgi:hypothetical protein
MLQRQPYKYLMVNDTKRYDTINNSCSGTIYIVWYNAEFVRTIYIVGNNK